MAGSHGSVEPKRVCGRCGATEVMLVGHLPGSTVELPVFACAEHKALIKAEVARRADAELELGMMFQTSPEAREGLLEGLRGMQRRVQAGQPPT